MTESDDLYVGGFGGSDQVDPSESLTGDNTDDPLDAGYSPPERESHSWRGDTADEARAGESLDQHLAEEEPDISADDDDLEPEERTGRLVAPDEGAHEDLEKDEIAMDVGRAGYAFSAEEAAMHVIGDDDVLSSIGDDDVLSSIGDDDVLSSIDDEDDLAVAEDDEKDL